MIPHFQRILLDTCNRGQYLSCGRMYHSQRSTGQQSAMVHALEKTEFRVKDTGAKRYHERRRPRLHKLQMADHYREQSDREQSVVYIHACIQSKYVLIIAMSCLYMKQQ